MFAYTLNPFVRVGLIAIEIGGIATYYVESLHDVEQLAQLFRAEQVAQQVAAHSSPAFLAASINRRNASRLPA